MKMTRIRLVVCGSVAPLLVAGCALYDNPSACERQMHSALAASSPAATLSVLHVGVAIGGSRVVVEGTIERPQADVDQHAALAVSAASAPSGPSAANPKKVTQQAAAAECMFSGETLASLRWLAPADLATPAEESGSENH